MFSGHTVCREVWSGSKSQNREHQSVWVDYSASFLAEISLSHAENHLLSLSKTNMFRIKASKKDFISFWKQKHWWIAIPCGRWGVRKRTGSRTPTGMQRPRWQVVLRLGAGGAAHGVVLWNRRRRLELCMPGPLASCTRVTPNNVVVIESQAMFCRKRWGLVERSRLFELHIRTTVGMDGILWDPIGSHPYLQWWDRSSTHHREQLY